MNDLSYINWNSMSDTALVQFIGRFVKAKRMELNKTQEKLAHAAGISRSTLSLLEKGETVTLATLIQVLRVLDQLPVLQAFAVQQTVSPIQLAKLEQKKRKRASGNPSSDTSTSTW
jgi:transcriptional regulator with XRE-family HTH domain